MRMVQVLGQQNFALSFRWKMNRSWVAVLPEHRCLEIRLRQLLWITTETKKHPHWEDDSTNLFQSGCVPVMSSYIATSDTHLLQCGGSAVVFWDYLHCAWLLPLDREYTLSVFHEKRPALVGFVVFFLLMLHISVFKGITPVSNCLVVVAVVGLLFFFFFFYFFKFVYLQVFFLLCAYALESYPDLTLLPRPPGLTWMKWWKHHAMTLP